MRLRWVKLASLVSLLIATASCSQNGAGIRAPQDVISHPSLREWPAVSLRPMSEGPARFVDSGKGDDRQDGSQATPWRTISHALTQLKAGGTLYLRGGVYYEHVRCAATGADGAPITFRGYPGERAVIDGGIRDFFDAPAASWEPEPDGVPGEYRSVRCYRNLGAVAGMFGDSSIGLNTYWLLADLRSSNEMEEFNPKTKLMDRTIYCGPGLWYDQESGRIHIRLAHTHNNNPDVSDYRGETDPRRMPLVISALDSVPLRVERARHIQFQDLILRGGGEYTIAIRNASHVAFDGVVLLCGSLIGETSGPVKFLNSAIYGRIAPWDWRSDSSQGCASGDEMRDIVRIITPCLFDASPAGWSDGPMTLPRAALNDFLAGRAEGRRPLEIPGPDAARPQMDIYPRNHDWEIAGCDFTEGHDGVFLVGRNMRFHHNLVDNMQDDALDISGALPSPEDRMYIYQNFIHRCVTPLSTHNWDIAHPRGTAFIFRNVIDTRLGVMWNRPSPKHPQGELRSGQGFFMHGSGRAAFVESVWLYQNTMVCPSNGPYAFAHGAIFHMKPGSCRRVFNNIFIYHNQDKSYPMPLHGLKLTDEDLQIDGNLHWNPGPEAKPGARFLSDLREHARPEQVRKAYPESWAANSLVADPKFVRYSSDGREANDYRLQSDSAAAGQGVVLPPECEDPLRPADGRRPDIGALPVGSEAFEPGLPGKIR